MVPLQKPCSFSKYLLRLLKVNTCGIENVSAIRSTRLCFVSTAKTVNLLSGVVNTHRIGLGNNQIILINSLF